MNHCVHLQNIYLGAGQQRLLEIADLCIANGERVAIIGPNGAGKSSLLRLVGGLLQPQQGRVEVLGQTLTPRAPGSLRQQIGHIMQGLHLVPRLDALENVLIGALARVPGWRSYLRLFPAHEVRAAEQALHEVGMLARAHVRSDRLSGGERQKVAIARLLIQGPRLILADEPTAALDPAASSDVCRLLVQAAQKAALICVVHNPTLLPLLAQRVIGLKQGRIAFDLPLTALSEAHLSRLYQPDMALIQSSDHTWQAEPLS